MGILEDKLFGFEDKDASNIVYQTIADYEGHDELLKALENINKNFHGRSFIELTAYRRNIPIICKHIYGFILMAASWKHMAESLINGNENQNKRWSKEDEEFLINAICDGYSISTLATALKRTPASITTKINELVGRKRLSQQIAGKFIGTANGSEFNADLVGTIYKGDTDNA